MTSLCVRDHLHGDRPTLELESPARSPAASRAQRTRSAYFSTTDSAATSGPTYPAARLGTMLTMSAYSPGQREDAPAAAADDQRRATRASTGTGVPAAPRDAVVVPGEGGAAVAPHGAHDLEALGQAGHAHRRRLHRDARLLVVGRHPAGADAELEAAAGDDVEGGRLLGQDDRVAEVVVEHERADPQRRGGLRRDGERRPWAPTGRRGGRARRGSSSRGPRPCAPDARHAAGDAAFDAWRAKRKAAMDGDPTALTCVR